MNTMRCFALCFSIVFSILAIVGIANPQAISGAAEYMKDPSGLYFAAGFRVGFGLLLLGAAGAARMPITVRILSGLFIFAGIGLLLLGHERLLEIMDWWLDQGITFKRIWMMFGFIFCVFMAFTLMPPRSLKSPSPANEL